MKKLLLAACLVLACQVAVHAQIQPNGYVSDQTITAGGYTTFYREGDTPAGFGWTEATLWNPDGSYLVLGHQYTPSYSQPVGPTVPGTYWIQYRLVDVNQDYADQWISFTVTPSNSGGPGNGGGPGDNPGDPRDQN